MPEQCSSRAAEEAFALLEDRWKLSILYHLFSSGGILRFSVLEGLIPQVSQRMLTQQLRALERIIWFLVLFLLKYHRASNTRSQSSVQLCEFLCAIC